MTIGQEIRAEIAGFKLEAVKGQAESAPSILFPFRGLLTPDEEAYEPDESSGSFEALTDSTIVYRAAMLDGDGPLDVRIFPYLMAMTMDGAMSPTTPVGATNARLWEATPTTSGNNHKTATIWTGDPGIALFRGAYGVCTGWEIATGEGRTAGTSLKASFMTQPMEAITTPISVPMKILATKVRPLQLEAWVDNLTQGGSIGVTSVLGRVISATHTLELQREPKQLPGGPNAPMTYTDVGRGTQQLNTKAKFHFTDLSIYNQWKADDRIALRVRHNGPLIEGALRHYVEIDNYGKWRDFGWAEFATTNRAIELTLRGLLQPSVGASFAARCQTSLAALN